MKSLFEADIYHKRFFPKENSFRYRGFYIKVDIDHLDELKSKIFGYNRPNFFSFYDRDHGDRKGGNLRSWALKILSQAGIENFKGKIVLQTFPRVLGHVFNPVSFWYCYEKQMLRAIICEVNNTFGESHNYVLTDNPSRNIHYMNKEFHVSPFYDVKGQYKFDFTKEDMASIDLNFENRVQLRTYIRGNRIEWSYRNLIIQFLRFPIYSIIILFLIHYQALRLYIKQIKFYSKPEKLSNEVTYEHTNK